MKTLIPTLLILLSISCTSKKSEDKCDAQVADTVCEAPDKCLNDAVDLSADVTGDTNDEG